MRKVGIEVVGNATSAARAFARTGEAAALFGREMTKVSITAAKSAEVQTKAALATQARLREQVTAARQLAASYALGSREQLAALGVANRLQTQLARTTGVTAAEQRKLLAGGGIFGGGGRRGGREEPHPFGRLRERVRLGDRFANVTGFGPGFLGLGGAVYALDKGVRAAMSFRSEMLLLRTQAGASQKEVNSMSLAVMRLATSVGQTPEALARGLYHIESYGYRGAKALKLLRLSAMGAAVGHDDIEATTKALLIMSKRGSKIGGVGTPQHAMGLLDAIIGAGDMRMADLTSAMGTGVVGSAAAFGVTMPQLGAAIATLTHAGMGSEESATRLRMTFALMAGGSEKAEKMLEKLGTSHVKLARIMRTQGLGAAFKELRDRLLALPIDERTAALTRMFGGGRSSGAIMTMLQQLGNFDRVQAQIAKQTGRFGSSWTAAQKSAAFATMNFKAALSVLGVTLGSEVLPALTKLMIRFTTWISRMVRTGRLQRDIHEGMKKIAAAAHFLGGIASFANRIAKAFGGWRNALKLLIALKLASMAAGWARSFHKLRIAAKLALGRGALAGAAAEGTGVAGLYVALAALAAIAAITIDIKIRTFIDDHTGGNFGKILGGAWKYGVSPMAFWHRDKALFNLITGRGGGKKTVDVTPTAADLSEKAGHGVHGALRVNAARRRHQYETEAAYHKRLQEERATARRRAAAVRALAADRAKDAPLLLGLQNSVMRARLTKGERDDLAALKAEERYLVKVLHQTGLNAKLRHKLLQELVEVRREESKLGANANARQFRLLGLDASGSALTPTKAALRRELGNVESVIKGTFLDTKKQRTLLGNIRRLLSGQLGALSRDVRDKIKELLDGLKGQLNEFDGFNLTAADRHRRWVDRHKADIYGGKPDHPRTGATVHHHTHHHFSPKVTAVQNEPIDRALRRAAFRVRHA